MSFGILYRQPSQGAFQLVLGDYEQVPGLTSVPLFSAPTTKFIDIIPADTTANYGRRALITVETSEIVLALGRDVTETDKLFIPEGGNIELDLFKQRVSASVLNGVDPALVQVWIAKYFKVS